MLTNGTPPDNHRCKRSDGRGWRCKQWRIDGTNYCEKHFYLRCKNNGRTVTGNKEKTGILEVLIQEEDQYLGVTKRKRVYGRHYCSSSIKVSDTLETDTLESDEEEDDDDDCCISDLLLPLKTSRRDAEVEVIEEILKTRELKLKMEKSESRKHVNHLVEDLGSYHTRCNELWSEIVKKKREISVVERKVEVMYGKEKVFEERIRDLECGKRRAENEVEFWKKMFKELETRVLVEPQVLRNLYGEEPRDETVFRGETASRLMMKVKEETVSYGGRGYGYTGVNCPSVAEFAGSSSNQHCVY